MLTTNQMLVRLGSWQLHKSGQKSGPGSAANVLLASMYASGTQLGRADRLAGLTQGDSPFLSALPLLNAESRDAEAPSSYLRTRT